MTRLDRHILIAASAIALSLTGCVNDDSPCPVETPVDSAEGVTLAFTVVTQNGTGAVASAPESRADDCDDEQEGSAAENYINMSDCQFLLFDSDRTLLRPIFPEVTATDNVSYTFYSVKAEITEKYFTEKVKAGESVTFYIMVIANTSSLSGQNIGMSPGSSTISNLANQRRTYTLAPRRDQWNVIATWSPSIDGHQYIPMAGLQKFVVAASDLKASTYDNPVDLSGTNTGGIQIADPKEINMLRAMAKIEVIDKIDMPDSYDPALRRVFVEKVELVGYNEQGTILPAIGVTGSWPNYISDNVTVPTLPSTDTYTYPGEFVVSSYGNYDPLMFFKDTVASQNNDGYPVYSAYITEYSKSGIGSAVKPYFAVTLSNNDGSDNNAVMEMKLAKYSDEGVAGADLDELLRNHIYRYEINAIKSDLLQGTWTVCEWNTATVNIPAFN